MDDVCFMQKDSDKRSHVMNTYEIKKILVPVDFSGVSLNALDTAIELSFSQGAELTLIHVIENNNYAMVPPDAGGFSFSVLSNLFKSADDELKMLASKIKSEHSIVVKRVVETGNPADEICRCALENKSNLIVMGTHGASGLREILIGSNAYRVVKNTVCPVMTIPRTNSWREFRKILFPIRLIPNALDKYDVVRPIIHKNGSSVLIVGMTKESDVSSMIEMRALTDYVKATMEEDNIICGCEVHYTENVAKHVLKISNIEKPDLIVITATLEESNREFFSGTYTQDIVNHSNFPVLSIRPDVTDGSIGTLSKTIVAAFDELYQK
jgi:nucleotide-binding universal stress UspA family protein